MPDTGRHSRTMEILTRTIFATVCRLSSDDPRRSSWGQLCRFAARLHGRMPCQRSLSARYVNDERSLATC